MSQQLSKCLQEAKTSERMTKEKRNLRQKYLQNRTIQLHLQIHNVFTYNVEKSIFTKGEVIYNSLEKHGLFPKEEKVRYIPLHIMAFG